MKFLLFLFVILYCFLLYRTFNQKRTYIHSQCKSYQQKNPSNLQQIFTVVDCIASTDFQQDRLISSASFQTDFRMEIQHLQQNVNLKGNIYLQTQCFQYQCEQLQFLDDLMYEKHHQQLKKYSLRLYYSISPSSLCKNIPFSLVAGPETHCFNLQPSKEAIVRVYSVLIRFRYILKGLITQGIQPASLYLISKQFSFSCALILALMGALILSQSEKFFKDLFTYSFTFIGFRNSHVMYLLLIIVLLQYLAIWNMLKPTLFVNFIFLYLYLRVVLQTQKARSTCAIIFSLTIAVIWTLLPFYQGQYQKTVYIIIGLILTIFQFFFSGFINSDKYQKSIIIFIIIVVNLSFILMLSEEIFGQASLKLLMNLPFIQLILMIASYKEEKTQNQQQSRGKILHHEDLQDIQLKINRQLGY